MRKIFIVEDNHDIGFVLNYFLKEEGFSVSVFPTVTSFQSTYRKETPDIFLLDIMLPDGNGLESL